ncbi:Aste57867_14351 [Aphanomyces stellatus]|uniref:Aste57867_14351 protein n=1 Tax=Aphanomyces stellatus TaxID=120398 RepID=A0A485L0G4_9STRA|nr:hypothetical protein As57867_014297 [Aphanomyces stellatus]VFT91175.1 Aste57867_14351 [Aphanomyces stellatus]
MPPGDILIHAGDFTRFGNLDDAVDFNLWLGELYEYTDKLIVLGNHECNASWKADAKTILTNATVLVHESVEIDGIRIFGSQFFWPAKGPNPYLDAIPTDTAILIAHGPVQGFVDAGKGCSALRHKVLGLPSLRLVVCGHIHRARGIEKPREDRASWVTSWLSWLIAGCNPTSAAFVNAANVVDDARGLEPPISASMTP